MGVIARVLIWLGGIPVAGTVAGIAAGLAWHDPGTYTDPVDLLVLASVAAGVSTGAIVTWLATRAGDPVERAVLWGLGAGAVTIGLGATPWLLLMAGCGADGCYT
ncbi:MAG: hypothetical protein M3340_07080 [Actinomycetota bacterium]|nr:hypothetical protein [Actinomycetota bacterium]